MRKAMLFLFIAAASVGLAGGFEFEARPDGVYQDAPAVVAEATPAAPRLVLISRIVTDGDGHVINTFQTVGPAPELARKMAPIKLRPPPIGVTYHVAVD